MQGLNSQTGEENDTGETKVLAELKELKEKNHKLSEQLKARLYNHLAPPHNAEHQESQAKLQQRQDSQHSQVTAPTQPGQPSLSQYSFPTASSASIHTENYHLSTCVACTQP